MIMALEGARLVLISSTMSFLQLHLGSTFGVAYVGILLSAMYVLHRTVPSSYPSTQLMP